jgi:hypothetical protein
MRVLALCSIAALAACGTVNEVARGAGAAAVGSVTNRGSGGGWVSSGGGSSMTPGPSRGPDDDEHWFQPDDWLIADRAYNGEGYMHVQLAKMKTAPGPQTKDQGQFFAINQAKDLWTAHYWKTRPATSADLALGNTVICFGGNHRDDVYQAPATKESARRETWTIGRVTDTSDLYRGFLLVSGWHCAPGALRVPVR